MPSRSLDSRLHRILPHDLEDSESTRRPQPQVIFVDSIISTMVATHGITIEIISSNGDMSSRNPEFENIVRAAVDIADNREPRLSTGDLLVHGDLDEQTRFTAALRYQDGRARSLIVKVRLDFKYRIKAINEMLESVDVETLDSENCGICIEPYTTAVTLSELETMVTTSEEPGTLDITYGFEYSITTPNIPHHDAVKMKRCGHVFGRGCIVQWMKENNTCPMCRSRVPLPIPCHLQVWVV
ncbi:hypothetical protein BOTCAL_1078g00030 [Botryotinia calthae]|uniref:RING-type domain-containing protein n=1 Tax=Botryotinia calthae TaxID=38488 RepID=A0A4Y8CEN3_9HELO|nr:hypothetical protein BOTCAL_1078g00030 [Botryotinia calthae]